MPTNDFLPFATGGSANVIDQGDYASASTTPAGYQTGLAKSNYFNKTWRQATVIASQLAQLVCDWTGLDMLDDTNTATTLANLKAALGNPVGSVKAVRTANYTALGTDKIIPVNAAGGTFNITIPRALAVQFTIPKQGSDNTPVYVYDDAGTPNLLFTLIAGGQAICFTYKGTDGNIHANGVQ